MINRKAIAEFNKPITKFGRTSTKLIITVLALLLVATIVAVAQRESIPVTRVQLCVKDNGQLRMADNGASCDPSEQLTEWVVGGQVTEIRPGQGLVGTRDDGIVNLALDPSILQNCTGCGRIFAGFNDGPGDIFGAFGDQIVAQSGVAGLSLPAGHFAIFAKLTLRNQDSIDEDSHPVKCLLRAGVDFDEARVVVEDEQDRNDNGVPDRDGATSLVMNLMVVHHFSEPGGATLFCVDGTPANPVFGTSQDDGDVKYEDLKLIAIEASSISNVFLGGN
jgi:hypothetical protein